MQTPDPNIGNNKVQDQDMKTIKWTSAMWLVAAALTLTACGKKQPAQQVKSNGLPQAGAKAQGGEVAFVDIDSLASQYEYYKNCKNSLEAKQKAFQNQIDQKAKNLQNAMMAFQKKLQSGGFTSEQQAQAEQNRILQQQQQLQQFTERINKEAQEIALNYQSALRDTLNNYLKEYNKDGRFKIILSKSDTEGKVFSNILYADKGLDITDDVVAGLNKRYSKKK